jgi:DNA-binding NtrC family response regulator
MRHNSTILIVDDEQVGRDTLEALLTGQGYDLAFASDGPEALAKAKELTPDLILLDVMMPGMDGFEVCRRLRSDRLLAEVPIVMVTALDDRDYRLQGIEAGADDFVPKPFDRVELRARVCTVTRLNRYRKLLAVNQQLESKIAQLSTLYDISSALNSATDVDVLSRSILQRAKELLDVDGASIILWDQRKDELHYSIAAVEDEVTESRLRQIHFPADLGIAGWVFREGKSAIVHNARMDDRFCEAIDENSGFVRKSILCVPLQTKQGVLGVLEVASREEGKFAEDDRHLIEAMAHNIAVAVEKANLYQNLQEAEALLRRQNAELRQAVKQKYRFENIIGSSKRIIDVLKKAEQVALTDSTVLIYGETGTGKELIAQAIHQSSPRSSRSFVPINCGAIPENLLESELFGHEKGAFTGATARRIGRFEEANGGTLFLDEIGDMPLNLQVRLLRVLQEGVIRRLGGSEDMPVDVRAITATHEDLAKSVAEGGFRRDLYYRLKVFELVLPPLRERREDIPLLVDHFITYYNERLGKQIADIEDAAFDVLREYDYPGNIRELQHIIEGAMILCRGNIITINTLPREVWSSAPSDERVADNRQIAAIPGNNEELKAAKAEARRTAEEKVERMFLTELLSETHGNVSEAARQARMNRSWLAQLISKHQLDMSQFRKSLK